MKTDSKQLSIAKEFKVHQIHLNDLGTLSTGKILCEIMKIYDQAIVNVFGELNFQKIVNSSYQLEFFENAYIGDNVNLRYNYILREGQYLEIDITVHKRSKKDQILAKGHFVFSGKKVPYQELVHA